MSRDTLMDSKQVAEYINVKPSTVRWYHKMGMMPPCDKRVGGSLAWYRSTIESWHNHN